MSQYLPDATDFTGMEIKAKPTGGYPASPDDLVACPKCRGYGGWNLRLNAYPNLKDPHFRASCRQCNGWGYVRKGSKDETCVGHDYKELSQDECRKLGIRHYGMCDHHYQCTKCGARVAYDSSD